ncbi:phosphatase PAP2 family protein [Pseudonocardia humida]|uniref:Phosphatase PAP2 family protein n=1 Tax=Pseudonocardia humida TaxID=2800819 RepID=A0ABT0ZTR1_9PSEU|nr:phosphatase PAP2 family protein [Pseudonocardia humida]MCO1654080.1 phosphatase PAP2 family protein [Pseudonocardia humida]
MGLAPFGLVLGMVVFALCATGIVLRTRRPVAALPGTPVLLGAALTAALFTGHAWVVLMVWRGTGPARLDGPALAWFADRRDPATTAAMQVASVVGDSPATTVAVLLVVVLLWWRGRPLTAVAAAVATLGSPLVSSGFKHLYARPRPPLADDLVAVVDSALPSGHAFNSAVVAGVLAVAVLPSLRRTTGRAVLVVVALAATATVGISRLYLGAHWLTDVLAGWMLGGAWLAGCLTVVAFLERPAAGPSPGPDADTGPHRALVAAS